MNVNKKKIAIVSGCMFIIIALIVLASLYISNKNIRDWVDLNLLRKNLTENDINWISLNTDKSNQVHTYSKYIAILNDKTISLYNSYAEKVTSIDINISTGIFDSSEKYLAVAEKGGKEFCLIFDKTFLWNESADSEILQIHVNKNGYVAVITTDIAHKAILTLYNPSGVKLFASFFSATRIIDASISNDNKYIALGEIDTSGTSIQSDIKIISIDNGKNDAKNTIIYTYNAEQGKLIANVEYHDNGKIVCMYDDGVGVIKENNYEEILKIEDEKTTYVSCELKDNIVYVEEKKEGLFQVSSDIHIINTGNNQDTIYKLDDIAKQIYTNENIIAVNVGIDMYFVNTSGWLVKKYTSNQEITNVKVSEELATIIYKDKIEIIDL